MPDCVTIIVAAYLCMAALFVALVICEDRPVSWRIGVFAVLFGLLWPAVVAVALLAPLLFKGGRVDGRHHRGHDAL